MPTRISKSFSFDAAHRLPNVPAGHKCARMHGHTYTVTLTVEGPLDPDLGWVMDYGEISTAFRPLREAFDHHVLNEIPGLENPTAEIMARWIFERLSPDLPLLVEVAVCETPRTAAVYRP